MCVYTLRSLDILFILQHIATVAIFIMTRVFLRIFSQYRSSCAKNMCHILLAGYEDVPSFLNQWKLIERPYIIKINLFY